MERVEEVKRCIVECIKGMSRCGIRVSLDKRSVDLEYTRFEKALARRLKKALDGLCKGVEVSAEWYEPEHVGIDVVCKSDGGEVAYFVNVPIMLKIDASSLSEKDVEVVE